MSASRLLRAMVPPSRRALAAPTSRHLIVPRSRRLHSSPTFRAPAYRVDPGDAQAYATASDEAMDSLVDSLSELIEDESAPLANCECDYSSGVLTLDAGAAGTYVINKQPPNKQIWLSSPKSGPKRYDFDRQAGEWFYARDGSRLQDLLDNELSEIAGTAVQVRVRHV